MMQLSLVCKPLDDADAEDDDADDDTNDDDTAAEDAATACAQRTSPLPPAPNTPLLPQT